MMVANVTNPHCPTCHEFCQVLGECFGMGGTARPVCWLAIRSSGQGFEAEFGEAPVYSPNDPRDDGPHASDPLRCETPSAAHASGRALVDGPATPATFCPQPAVLPTTADSPHGHPAAPIGGMPFFVPSAAACRVLCLTSTGCSAPTDSLCGRATDGLGHVL